MRTTCTIQQYSGELHVCVCVRARACMLYVWPQAIGMLTSGGMDVEIRDGC